MRRLMMLLAVSGLALAAERPVDEFQTSAGPLKVTVIRHASFMIEAGGQVIHVDPWSQGNYEGLPQADILLLTDIHGDHLDAKQIAAVRKASTVIVAPKAVADKLEGTAVTVMANGDSKTIGPWKFDAVPMYNLPAEGKQMYHEKGRGNGYVITYGGLRIYNAGDTEGIPEMLALENIDVAFIPMNLPYTMTPEAAAVAVKAFHPKVVYPYHYRDQDTKVFANGLAGTGIDVRLRDWYY